MTKELFMKTIKCIKEGREKENVFLEALDKLSPDTHNETFLFADYETLVVELLKDAFDDTDDIIGWFVYETDFGANNSINCLFAENGNITITSEEELYNYLTKK